MLCVYNFHMIVFDGYLIAMLVYSPLSLLKSCIMFIQFKFYSIELFLQLYFKVHNPLSPLSVTNLSSSMLCKCISTNTSHLVKISRRKKLPFVLRIYMV